jgi:SAM-dependent methyltransferase
MWPTERNRAAWEERFRHGPTASGLPDAVRERLPDVGGKHVLHLRCGTGEATADLIALGALVSAIDPSEAALAVARERAPGAAFFQAALHEIPLQLRRRRFTLAYAGEGTVVQAADVATLLSTAAAALRKGGWLALHDRHPVADCVEPVGLRWRESYFEEDRLRLAEIVTAVARSELALELLEELPAASKERGDPRLPAEFLLLARKTETGSKPD